MAEVGFRDRQRKPARRGPVIEPRRRLLVVTEGELTEPQYLRGFAKAFRNQLVDIQIEKGPGTPRNRVERAKALKAEAAELARSQKDDNLAYDAVWCVFDVDAHPKISEAKDIAASNNIELAITNPCFELWLVLHFRESPGDRHRQDVQKLLGTFVKGYGKSVEYQDFAAGYEDAVKRATRLDEAARDAGEEGRSPTTGVYRLTESIRGR